MKYIEIKSEGYDFEPVGAFLVRLFFTLQNLLYTNQLVKVQIICLLKGK